MALRAFGVKPGDEVLVPSHTAFPTVEAVCFAGGVPIFVDVDESYTVDLTDAAAKITPRTVGFVPVHLYGHPADLPGIGQLCAERGLWLLEDCAQAHGAAWQGRKVGSFGRAGAFSFYPSKNLTVMATAASSSPMTTTWPPDAAGCATTGVSTRTFTSRSDSTSVSTTSRPPRAACCSVAWTP